MAALTGEKLSADDGPDSLDVLDALTGEPTRPLRDHVVLAPLQKQNLAIRQGDWVYIGAKGGGGFAKTQPGEHGLGGPAALKFAGEENSDVVDGRLKADAPPAQLYNLATDPAQSRNVVRENPELAARLQALLDDCRTKPRTAPSR